MKLIQSRVPQFLTMLSLQTYQARAFMLNIVFPEVLSHKPEEHFFCDTLFISFDFFLENFSFIGMKKNFMNLAQFIETHYPEYRGNIAGGQHFLMNNIIGFIFLFL